MGVKGKNSVRVKVEGVHGIQRTRDYSELHSGYILNHGRDL